MSERPLLFENPWQKIYHYGYWREFSLAALQAILAELESGLIVVSSHQVEALKMQIEIMEEAVRCPEPKKSE